MSVGVTRRRLISRGDLPGSNGGIYNPGALVTGDKILLLCRREIDYRFRNDFVFPELIELDRDTLEIVGYRTLLKVGFPPDTRIEDFRCIRFDGMHLAAHSSVTPGRIRPVISRVFDDALQHFDSFALPIKVEPVEKNWVLFVHNAELHCLYKLDPLTLFVRRDGAWQLLKQEHNRWSTELERGLSNSTNLIPFDDGYLGFWHTIVRDRYIQGAFLLGPDLKIKYRTGVLLNGDEIQEGYKPGVIYVSALIEDRGRVFAFYGEGDAHTGVAIFNRAELVQELRRKPFEPTESIRVRFEGDSYSDAIRAIQGLREFSERRQHARIRLYVAEPTLRATLQKLAPEPIFVHESRPDIEVHCAINARTSVVHWDIGRNH